MPLITAHSTVLIAICIMHDTCIPALDLNASVSYTGNREGKKSATQTSETAIQLEFCIALFAMQNLITKLCLEGYYCTMKVLIICRNIKHLKILRPVIFFIIIIIIIIIIICF